MAKNTGLYSRHDSFLFVFKRLNCKENVEITFKNATRQIIFETGLHKHLYSTSSPLQSLKCSVNFSLNYVAIQLMDSIDYAICEHPPRHTIALSIQGHYVALPFIAPSKERKCYEHNTIDECQAKCRTKMVHSQCGCIPFYVAFSFPRIIPELLGEFGSKDDRLTMYTLKHCE